MCRMMRVCLGWGDEVLCLGIGEGVEIVERLSEGLGVWVCIL